MSIAPHTPAPNQDAAHPALRLAEAIGALLTALIGPSWFWRFLPGGRAFVAQMQRFGAEFAALMARIAAAPPAAEQPIAPAAPRAAARSVASRPSQPTTSPRATHPRATRRPAPQSPARAPTPKPPRAPSRPASVPLPCALPPQITSIFFSRVEAMTPELRLIRYEIKIKNPLYR